MPCVDGPWLWSMLAAGTIGAESTGARAARRVLRGVEALGFSSAGAAGLGQPRGRRRGRLVEGGAAHRGTALHVAVRRRQRVAGCLSPSRAEETGDAKEERVEEVWERCWTEARVKAGQGSEAWR